MLRTDQHRKEHETGETEDNGEDNVMAVAEFLREDVVV